MCFFKVLNINFIQQGKEFKAFSGNYLHKGDDYQFRIFFISGDISHPALLPSGETECDAIIFLINPFITDVFTDLEKDIIHISKSYPDALIILIMQNIFEDLENLDPIAQEIAINNGADFCELVNVYNLLLFSLNYSSVEIEALNAGHPGIQDKFHKMFYDVFYVLMHEIIERRNDPEKKTIIRTEKL